jgi:hypothetical protein
MIIDKGVCETCIFFELCTPFEQRLEDYGWLCENYIDIESERLDYCLLEDNNNGEDDEEEKDDEDAWCEMSYRRYSQNILSN